MFTKLLVQEETKDKILMVEAIKENAPELRMELR